MKKVNKLAGLALAAYAVMTLAACSKTSDSSTPAAAAAYNGYATCPANGYTAGVNGQYTPCTPGQPVYNSTGTTYGAPGTGYPYSSYPTAGSGCAVYNNQPQYNYATYVPIYLNGQLVCANYADLIQSMQSTSYSNSYQSSPYYSDPNYYYAYPPVAYGQGSYGGNYYGNYSSGYSGYGGYSGCGAAVAFSFGGFSGAACF